MNRAGRGVIGLLALALVAGCTVKQQEPTVTFEDAQRRVVALVDDTLTAALPSLRLDQPARVERQSCNGALGAPSQDVYLHFERTFPMDGPQAEQLVAATDRTWRERGYAVEPDDRHQGVFIRYATLDGYDMRLVVNRTTKRVYLGASSPCVRPPSRT
jgi:hypothetical protein